MVSPEAIDEALAANPLPSAPAMTPDLRERVRKVLEPFAAEEVTWSLHVPDDHIPLIRGSKAEYLSPTKFTIGDLRAVRALLSELTEPQP